MFLLNRENLATHHNYPTRSRTKSTPNPAIQYTCECTQTTTSQTSHKPKTTGKEEEKNHHKRKNRQHSPTNSDNNLRQTTTNSIMKLPPLRNQHPIANTTITTTPRLSVAWSPRIRGHQHLTHRQQLYRSLSISTPINNTTTDPPPTMIDPHTLNGMIPKNLDDDNFGQQTTT